MRLGALLGPVNPEDSKSIAVQAYQLEAEGYDSLWSAHAMGRGMMYMDPFVALSVAAAVTEKVELGTGILQLPLYEPADVALKCFSLMQVSGDRLILGVGAGSTAIDHQLNNSDFEKRFSKFNHDLKLLRQWFADGSINDLSLSPWPNVLGGPRLAYGTWGAGVKRAANQFDAWIASGMHRNVDDLEKTIVGYRQEGGQRAIVSTILLSKDTDMAEMKDTLTRYEAAGFDDAVVMFLPGAPSPSDISKLLN
jgi:alkanesulfonate monooxygenase SsuD/methylene tetrahydromethanopterin reductase-like flavin-dependent oxidoreductase (luciferase family)